MCDQTHVHTQPQLNVMHVQGRHSFVNSGTADCQPRPLISTLNFAYTTMTDVEGVAQRANCGAATRRKCQPRPLISTLNFAYTDTQLRLHIASRSAYVEGVAQRANCGAATPYRRRKWYGVCRTCRTLYAALDVHLAELGSLYTKLVLESVLLEPGYIGLNFMRLIILSVGNRSLT